MVPVSHLLRTDAAEIFWRSDLKPRKSYAPMGWKVFRIGIFAT